MARALPQVRRSDRARSTTMEFTLLPPLVLAIAAALVGAALASRFGQSVVVGYLLAGVAIGPYTPGLVARVEVVERLAELGIIFLLFAVGVQLPLRPLLRAGRAALLGGTAQVVLIVGLGTLLGRVLGFGALESLFFGTVLANSSSTVLSKILSERGEAGAEHARLAFAWSSVQDLLTVGQVVVLAWLAAPDGAGVDSSGASRVLGAVLFLALVTPAAFLLVPRALDRIQALRQREVFVLAVAVIALGMAWIAEALGISAALGAFLAGLAVGGSHLSHHALGQAAPIRDLFAGLFFVSIGMLVDPAFIVREPHAVAVAFTAIVIGKGAVTALLARATGASPRIALLVGAGLAQSGEFSFLLARLGVDLGVVRSTSFNAMLAAAALSILVAPMLARFAPDLARRLGHERRRDEEDTSHRMREHAIVAGYGRVGRTVCGVLESRRLPFVVIEEDRRLAFDLRRRDVPVIVGDAANPVVLDRAGARTARLLVLAIPDPFAARLAIDLARRWNPQIEVVARTHDATERASLLRHGADAVIMGELELGLEMTRHTLVHFGVGLEEANAVTSELRSRAYP